MTVETTDIDLADEKAAQMADMTAGVMADKKAAPTVLPWVVKKACRTAAQLAGRKAAPSAVSRVVSTDERMVDGRAESWDDATVVRWVDQMADETAVSWADWMAVGWVCWTVLVTVETRAATRADYWDTQWAEQSVAKKGVD